MGTHQVNCKVDGGGRGGGEGSDDSSRSHNVAESMENEDAWYVGGLLEPWHDWKGPEYFSGGKLPGVDFFGLKLETQRALGW